MLSLPEIVERNAVPYAAVRRDVSIPFGAEIGPAIGTLFSRLESGGGVPDGPVFFKYNKVVMPELQVEFGVPLARAMAADEVLVTSELPAGRYAKLDYFGDYANLIEVNAVLIGWVNHHGLRFDSEVRPDGEHFACRIEIYHNGPDDEPDPEKWHTTLLIKLQDA